MRPQSTVVAMPKLAAVVATVDDIHTRHKRELVVENKRARQPALYNGQIRTYEPFDDAPANRLPTETTAVQVIATDQLARILDLHAGMWDAAATRDRNNMVAKADVVVDGIPLIKDAPVPFLLYLDKQLGELQELVSNVPTRDPAEQWEFDEDNGVYRTAPAVSHRTQKMDRVITLAPATDKHPAQVTLHWEDRPVGTLHTTRFTGAWSLNAKRALLDRITRLTDAVKRAKTEANQIEAVEWEPARAITQYLWPATGA